MAVLVLAARSPQRWLTMLASALVGAGVAVAATFLLLGVDPVGGTNWVHTKEQYVHAVDADGSAVCFGDRPPTDERASAGCALVAVRDVDGQALTFNVGDRIFAGWVSPKIAREGALASTYLIYAEHLD
ncbi:hypothetical protein [Phytoactinopolyspora limicola]|uniref:hypothetical protein n=1 Tax=Phytoactinopolyspora limicola TaxID=2715536 RepID=UPI00140B27BB|nr:hypothetical protein [Phytoactinopolyspora limicola]